MSVLRKISNILSWPVLLHYVLPVLIVYLVAGTVAQKYIGLYEATRMFFASPVLWLGPVPLPGLPVLIALIFINLAFKLVFKSPWIPQNAGIIIVHIGALLLLLGGLFTALFSQEGYIDLAPGEQKVFVSDYHIRELALLDAAGKTVKAIRHKSLKEGDIITFEEPGFSLSVMEACRNCDIKARAAPQEDFHGMAQHMALQKAPLRMEDEQNLPGLTFAVKGSADDGVYLVLENVPKNPEISVGGKAYRLVLRKQRRDLPFTIELLDFKREMHPGTDLARAYSSRVRITDGTAQWESLIRMNEPLRYKGYTFFQSSFIETPDGDVSVLSAVRNAGRAFPYISGIVMCIGMIVHLFVRRHTQPIKEGAAHVS